MKYELIITDMRYFKYSKQELIKEFGFVCNEKAKPYCEWEDEYIPVFIEINSLEELHDFIKKVDSKIIITKDNKLEIYNGGRE
jgi:hypothetical protein